MTHAFFRLSLLETFGVRVPELESICFIPHKVAKNP